MFLLGIWTGLSEDRKDEEAACEQNRGAAYGSGPNVWPPGTRSAEGWARTSSPQVQMKQWALETEASPSSHSTLSRPSPVILGAEVQGRPPLDCSGSPKSKGSRGLGLYSRLGREEASRTLPGG
jgi:hypothetical protein